jgi:uncharacterized Zn-binding protein involved in type VI secretion
MFKQVKGDAGKGTVSETSLDTGYVKILEGHSNVKVNGIPVVAAQRPTLTPQKAGDVDNA